MTWQAYKVDCKIAFLINIMCRFLATTGKLIQATCVLALSKPGVSYKKQVSQPLASQESRAPIRL
jgi:hypothetical protein